MTLDDSIINGLPFRESRLLIINTTHHLLPPKSIGNNRSAYTLCLLCRFPKGKRKYWSKGMRLKILFLTLEFSLRKEKSLPTLVLMNRE